MKKVGLFLIAVAFAFSVQAKDILAENVPANVKSYVSKNYPSANYVEWEMKDNGAYYKAEFKIDAGREAKVKIANDGQLISAKEDMLIKDIPSFATNYIKKNYKNATVLGANKRIDNGGVSYDVGIRFKNEEGYDRHRNIVFDSKGNVIKQ